jgi:uncharacterized membrane protein YhaH (DUF805 family)
MAESMAAGNPLAGSSRTLAEEKGGGSPTNHRWRKTVSFGEAIATCLAKYATFSGRASRSEYWWFYLFTLLMQWGSLLVDPSGQLGGLVAIFFLLPNWAAAVRRLHDTGRSGWWLLIGLTIIGMIPLLVWSLMPSHDEANSYDGDIRQPKSRRAKATEVGLPLFRYTAYSPVGSGVRSGTIRARDEAHAAARLLANDLHVDELERVT